MHTPPVYTPYTLNSVSATYSWNLGGRKSAWFDEMNQPQLVVLMFGMVDFSEEKMFPEFYSNGDFDEAAFDAALDAMFADYDDGYDEVEDVDTEIAQQMLSDIGIKC